jgi:hypothetical protein
MSQIEVGLSARSMTAVKQSIVSGWIYSTENSEEPQNRPF